MQKKRSLWIAILIISLFADAFLSITLINRETERNHETLNEVLADSVYNAIDNAISKPIRTAQTMSSDSFLVRLLEHETEYSEEEMLTTMTDYLAQLKNGIHADTSFVISDKSCRYYTNDGLNKIIDIDNDDHDVWYAIFVNGHKAYDLDVDVDQANDDRWTVFVNSRIEDAKGKLLGVCGVGVAMTDTQDLLKHYEDKYQIKINLVNSDGLIQVDTDSINIENAHLYDVQYGKDQDGYHYVAEDGSYVSMRYIESLNWYLVIHSLPNTSNTQYPFIFTAMGIMLILGLAAVFHLTKKS